MLTIDMHTIEPFPRWINEYHPAKDERSPFFGKEYNYELYSDTIYGYYIDPAWDFMGSETLYLKVLWVHYEEGAAIVEFIGEWNDALNNDIMHLKRNIIDHFGLQGINKYILIGENVFNFHGSDDSYYEEWFDEVEDGWIAAVAFPDHVLQEWGNFGIDQYVVYGGTLQIGDWRTKKPHIFYKQVSDLVTRRIDLI